MSDDPLAPQAPPPQARVTEGIVSVPNAKLWYWDTGGKGETVVLCHPATGSALVWPYQQPVLAQAGYRVISYSRRGYYNSPGDVNADPGTGAGDLHSLVNALGLRKFHIVSSAAGSGIGVDYALSYPERLLSFTNANGIGGPEDAEYQDLVLRIRPEGFDDYPPEFRELGPSYRAANPEGVKEWKRLESIALAGKRIRQLRLNKITKAGLAKMRVPTLLMTGDADLYFPPALLRRLTPYFPVAEATVVPESGHSIYWERPDIFNRIVLDFLRRHPE